MSVQQFPYSALYVHAGWHFLQIVLDATLMHMLERFFQESFACSLSFFFKLSSSM